MIKKITNNNWIADNVFGQEGSISTYKNGMFHGKTVGNTGFAVTKAGLGIMHHKWSEGKYNPLDNEFRIELDKSIPTYLEVDVKRISDIIWHRPDINWSLNNLGMDLVADVGLGYDCPGEGNRPCALTVDFVFDTPMIFNRIKFQQSVHEFYGWWSDADYHSVYPLGKQNLIFNKVYKFKTRIDGYLQQALRRWKLKWANFKFAEFYVESIYTTGEAEMSNMEIYQII